MSASPQLSKASGTQPATERRRNRRRSIVDEQIIPVTLDGDNGGLVLDLGENGLAVQAVAPLQPGKTTEMTFVLPDTRTSICALGDVRWAEPSGRAGIRLLAFSKGSSNDIRAALAQPAPPPVAAEKHMPIAPPPALAVDSLESEIASRNLDREAALGYLAERTCELASASGIAIALGAAQQMMCRASAGAAPPVGLRVQSDSGLSGECVRTGLLVRCDDTETDARVDAAVCRQLDLRSAVLVPILDGGRLGGVLEVFSSRPHAFASDDIRRFEQVAALIVKLTREPAPPLPVKEPAAPAPEKLAPKPPVVESAPRASSWVDVEETVPLPDLAGTLPLSSRLPLKYVVAGCATIVLALAAGWGVARYRRAANPAPVASTVAAAVAAQASVETTAQPVAEQVVASTPIKQEPLKPAKEQKPIVKSETSAPPDEEVTVRHIPSTTAPAQAEAVAAPPMMVATAGPLPDLSTPHAEPAKPTPPRALGGAVVPGRLLRRVNPVYPDMARRTHIGGTVVLKAVIRPDGNVGAVEVVSGRPQLLRAAIDAVRQWRYEPFRLNGTPVQAEAEIRLDFNPDLHPKR